MQEYEKVVPVATFKPTFNDMGFVWRETTKKVTAFQLKGQQKDEATSYVYLLDNKQPTIVVHPHLADEDILRAAGLASEPMKHTGLKAFPRKIEGNVAKSNYGYAFKFDSPTELAGFLTRVATILRAR